MNAEGHLTTEETVAYWLRTLPSSLIEISDHLQKCARCRQELMQVRPMDVSTSEPQYEDLVDWMEQKLDPIEQHELARRLQNSPQAAAEFTDLLKFWEQMSQLPERIYSPEDAPPSGPSWILPIVAVAETR